MLDRLVARTYSLDELDKLEDEEAKTGVNPWRAKGEAKDALGNNFRQTVRGLFMSFDDPKDAEAGKAEVYAMVKAAADPSAPAADAKTLRRKFHCAAEILQDALGDVFAKCAKAGCTAEEVLKEVNTIIYSAWQEAKNDNEATNDNQKLAKLLTTWGDWERMPAPVWQYENIIPERALVIVNGKSQSFKTFFTLDLLYSTATGALAFGTRKPSKTGLVVYCPSEGKYSFKTERVRSLVDKRGRKLSADNFAVYEQMPQVGNEIEITEMIAAIEALAAGKPVQAICFDTLTGLLGGLSGNDQEKMGLVVKLGNRLIDHFGCTVYIISHPPKSANDDDANILGSYVAFGGVDVVLQVSRQSAGYVSKIVAAKQKDGEAGYEFFIEGEKIGLGVNAMDQPRSSLVFHEIDKAALASGQDDFFGDVRCALERLEARDDRSAVGSRSLAREVARIEFPDIAAEGYALKPPHEARVRALVEQLRVNTGNPRFRGLVKRRGLGPKSPWIWSLPPEEAYEVAP